jgi:Rps23 Pro-64 3,4-dihydroxylase Tpa1-like proline 4-hydroxylase
MKQPFDYWVIDNFFPEEQAKKLSNEFLDYENPSWFNYNNPVENKKTLNHWYNFPSETYKTFSYLNSPEFIDKIKEITGIKNLYPDIGLHGGGWHIHKNGGKLNVHLDYSVHPKLHLQRKLNLIVYLSENWDINWGGSLELWTHDPDNRSPKNLSVTVDNIFNRAIIFDTTQNSWHGFPKPLTCPDGTYRKSLAVYYLTDPPSDVDPRSRALYAPYDKQKEDFTVLDFIKKRAS